MKEKIQTFIYVLFSILTIYFVIFIDNKDKLHVFSIPHQEIKPVIKPPKPPTFEEAFKERYPTKTLFNDNVSLIREMTRFKISPKKV